MIFTGLIKQFGNPLSFHAFTTVDTVHHMAFLTYVITSHNVMVYTVINVVSVYGPDTLHNRMSSAAVLISGHVVIRNLNNKVCAASQELDGFFRESEGFLRANATFRRSGKLLPKTGSLCMSMITFSFSRLLGTKCSRQTTEN